MLDCFANTNVSVRAARCLGGCSQLVIMFFSPATADDERLRQCLSLFFKVFAFSSTSHAMIIEEAFMTTLRQGNGTGTQ